MKEDVLQHAVEERACGPLRQPVCEFQNSEKSSPYKYESHHSAPAFGIEAFHTALLHERISVNMETFINTRVSYNAMHPDRKVSMNAMLMKVDRRCAHETS